MVVDPIRFSQRFCHAGWPEEKETFGVAQATSYVQRPDSSSFRARKDQNDTLWTMPLILFIAIMHHNSTSERENASFEPAE